jgi:mercuric ion binding protein
MSSHCFTDIGKEIVMTKILAAIVLTAGFSSSVWAASQTVTLLVPGMTCSACPITVKHALNKVEGVEKIDVSFKSREAVITFDDAKTSVEALTKASGNAGYPASLKKSK